MNENFFRSIITGMQDGVWVSDNQHRIIYANDALVRIAEIPLDKLVGMNVFEFFPEATLPHFRDLYLATAQSRQSQSWRCQIVRDNGEAVWQGGWLSPLLDNVDNGELHGIICTVQDITAAKKLETSLREKETLLRTVIDEFPDPIVLKDYKGDFLLCNKAVATLYNTTPAQMEGKHDDDFGVPKEMADVFRQTVLATMAKGETSIIFEDSQDAVSGEIRHYRSIKKPFKDSNGINQILIIAQDITDVIRSQAKVKESENRLQEVLRVTQEGIWDWHLPTGKIIHNAQWYKILGLTEGETGSTVESFAELIHPDHKAAVMHELEALLKGETDVYQSEHQLLGKNGPIWVQDRGGISERDENGNPLRVVGSCTDISVRRAMETKITRLFEEQQAILQSEVVGIAMLNGDSISWVNHAYAHMFGYTTAELTNQPAKILYTSEETYLVFKKAADAVIKTGEVFRTQIQYPRKGSTPGWFDISGAQLHAGSEASIWAIVDISAQKQTEAELIEARQAAEQASLAKSQFLATMSHEIRTPMNGILGMAQLLQMSGLTPQDRDDYIKTILSSGQTLLTLLNDILDLSKVEAGKLALAYTPCDPQLIIDEMGNIFAAPSESKGLKIEALWYGAQHSLYLCDPVRLRQMLSNLISNAIKFTAQGIIKIESREVERKQNQAILEFSVSDSGIGIPLEKQSLLFKHFTQVDSTNTRQYGGTGLGLSIVHNLAKLMGGEVGVVSELGKGARFWFRIAAELPLPNKITPKVFGDSENARKNIQSLGLSKRILTVEDNPTNRKVIESLLAKLGLQVESVHNGQQALDAVMQGLQPDLILMDCQMPVMDGFEATERIRAWEEEKSKENSKETSKPRNIIVALTAGAFEEDRQRCMDVGMDDFIAKPVSLNDLATVISKWLKP